MAVAMPLFLQMCLDAHNTSLKRQLLGPIVKDCQPLQPGRDMELTDRACSSMFHGIVAFLGRAQCQWRRSARLCYPLYSEFLPAFQRPRLATRAQEQCKPSNT